MYAIKALPVITGESVADSIIRLGDRLGRKDKEEAAVGSRYV